MTTETSIPPERALGRVEGKLDLLLTRFDTFDQRSERKEEAASRRHASLEGRVTSLERRFTVLTIAGAASIAAYVGDIKTSLLTIIKAVF